MSEFENRNPAPAPGMPPPQQGNPQRTGTRHPTSTDVMQRTAGVQDARRAALNLMEDAVAARQEVEALNKALFESAERLAKELDAARQLQSASALLIEGGDTGTLYQKIVDAAAAIMRSDGASMQCLDEPGDALRLLAFRGFVPDFGRLFALIEADGRTACRIAMRRGERVIVPDVETWDFVAGTPALEDHRRMGVRAVQSTPLFSRDGHLVGVISTHWGAPHTPAESDLILFDVLARQAADLLERKRVEEALQRAFDFDEAVMANMNEGLYTLDRQGLVTSMNHAAAQLFGWSFGELRGKKMHEVTHHHRPDGTVFAAEECAIFRVLETGEPLTGHEGCFIRKDGSFFPVIYSGATLRDGDGIVGLVVVFRDVTERKAAEERERLLAKELAHRNRNLLAVIQTIVSRSLVEERTPAEARGAVMQRLQALARSQTALESGGFEGASLAEIARLEFQAFSGRIEAAGPEVILNPQAAQTFAMLLHELATNATKYGALSRPGGRVCIDWSISAGDAESRFRFQWLERGGPPVTAPSRHGFGSVMIRKIAARDFGAQAKIDFAPDGLRYELDAALSALVS